jgi:hypothetical protein
MTPEAQEVRNQTIGASVTPTEKRLAELTATVEKRPLSQLLREYTLSDLIDRGREYADRLDAMEPAA